MARRGLSLGTKLILGTTFLIAAAVASSAWYGLSTIDTFAQASGEARSKDLEQANQREAELLARNAAASASSLLATSDYTRLEETAKQLAAENRNVVWIALIENSGAVAGTSDRGPAKTGGKIENVLTPKLANIAAGKVEIVGDPTNAAHRLVGTPVFVTDSAGKAVRVGTVQLAFDMS